MSNITAILLLLLITSVILLIVTPSPTNKSTEIITQQTYYTDSLQYLEDIRNSNDEILINCKK